MDQFFKITRARIDGRPGGPRRHRHVLHDGLHHRAEPADHRHPDRRRGQVPRRRRRPEPPAGRAGHGGGRRADDDPHGRRREVPAGAGHRARAQRVRDVLDRQGLHLDRGDDVRLPRGRDHPRPGAHRLPDRGVQGGADVAEDRDQRRHRPLHRADRPGRRRLRAAYGRRAGAGRARHRRRCSTAGRRWSSCSAWSW